MKKTTFIILLCVILALCASAHSGRTDSKGGHYNRRTGEYHYHHGEPAHQHPGGVCPYATTEVETKTDSDNDDIGLILALVGASVGAYTIFKK